MPYYKDMPAAKLQMLHTTTKQLVARYAEQTAYLVSKGAERSTLRSAELEDAWRKELRLIVAVARKRGIELPV